MLHIGRNNNPFTVLILFIVHLIINIGVLMHPVMPVYADGIPAYNGILEFLTERLHFSGFGCTLLAVLMIFAQALYLNAIALKHRLYLKPTYLPAFTYVILAGMFPVFSTFNNSLFVVWCVLGAFDVMLSFMQPANPRKFIFNAGFLVGLSAMFQFSAAVYLLLLIAALLFLRSFSLGEWFVGLLGFLTVFYFFVGILFVTGKTYLLLDYLKPVFIFKVHITNTLYVGGLLLGLLILTICGFFTMQLQMPKSSIFIRRSSGVVVSALVVAVIVGVLTIRMPSAWLVLLPALSLITAYPMCLEKNRMFSNFAFYFSLLLLVFCQLAILK